MRSVYSTISADKLLESIKVAGSIKYAAKQMNIPKSSFFRMLKHYNVDYQQFLKKPLYKHQCEICDVKFDHAQKNLKTTCPECDELDAQQMKALNALSHRKCEECDAQLPKSRYFKCIECVPQKYRYETEDAMWETVDDMDVEE